MLMLTLYGCHSAILVTCSSSIYPKGGCARLWTVPHNRIYHFLLSYRKFKVKEYMHGVDVALCRIFISALN